MAAYLPVYCAACAHASLWAFDERESQPRCSFCEGTARVVPGPAFGDGDWLAFAEIDKAVAEAELLGVQASELADELQELMNSQQPPLAIVQRMIDRLPALANARAALVNRLPRGPRMLMTLLSARSRDLALEPGTYPTTLLGSG